MKNILLLFTLLTLHQFSKAQPGKYPTGATGCIARWTFTDKATTTILPDSSGNMHHGTASNLSSSKNFRGTPHTAMRFNGSSSYALVPHDTALNPQKITIIAVVQPLGFYKGTCQGNNIIYKSYDYNTKPGTWAMHISDYDGSCTQYTSSKELLDFAGPSTPAPYTLPAANYIDSNKWYFIALTYNGDTLRRYQLLMDTNSLASSIAPISLSKMGYTLGKNTYDVRIGATQEPSYPYWFNGDMDEVVLFNRALPDTEVYSIYKYIWKNKDQDTSHQHTDTVCCCQTIIPPGCIAHWSFTDSLGKDTLLDVSGNKHNGKGTDLSVSKNFRGLDHTAMRFNGSTSFGLVSHDTTLNPQKITIIALVQPRGFYKGTCQGNNIIYKSYDYNTKPGTWAMNISDYDGSCTQYTPSQEVLDFAGPATPLPYTIPAGNYIDSNKWYFLALTYNGDTLKRYQLFMDTNALAPSITPTSSSKLGYTLGKNTYDVRIGATQEPNYPYWFNGDMDEILLFDRALADTEVYCIYKSLWQKPGTVSVGAINSKASLQLYPNPNNGSFTISGYAAGKSNLHIDVTNMAGQVVYSEEIPAVSGNIIKQVTLPNAADGVYIVRLRSENETMVSRLVIRH